MAVIEKNSTIKKLEQLERQRCCLRTQFFNSREEFPDEGKAEVLYINNNNGGVYVWNGSTYVTGSIIPTPTPSPTTTLTATPTPTPTSSGTPTPSPTSSATSTPTPTSSGTSTPTPTPTSSPTPSSTSTPTPTPTAT